MNVGEDYRALIPHRDEVVAAVQSEFDICGELETYGFSTDFSSRLAEVYVDHDHFLRHAYVPAWHGLVRALSLRTPALHVVNEHNVYDKLYGRHVVDSYRSAELIWGFSATDIDAEQPTRRHLYVALHALPNNNSPVEYDAILPMPEKRARQKQRRMTAFRDWFCEHANIIEVDTRCQAYTDSYPLNKKVRTLDFFSAIEKGSGIFGDPAHLGHDLAKIAAGPSETDLNGKLGQHLKLAARSVGTLHKNTIKMAEVTKQVNHSIDLPVPDNGDVWFLVGKPEWLPIDKKTRRRTIDLGVG